MSERQLASQIRGMTQAAVADQRIGDQDLVPILEFISSVVLVVEQAFTSVYTQLIELSYARPEDLLEPRRTQILKSLDSVLERSRYRDVEEICSRLHHLSEHYSAVIRPKLGHLATESEWAEVFALLNEYEGRIMLLVRSRLRDIGASLETAKTNDLDGIRKQQERQSTSSDVLLPIFGSCGIRSSAYPAKQASWNSWRRGGGHK